METKPKFMPNQYAHCECELLEEDRNDFPICTYFEPEIVDGDWVTDICVACRHGEECHLKGHAPAGELTTENPTRSPRR